MENDLTSQGIAAYNAGDKQEAARLLSEAVREEKTNPDAWFYLAQVLTDPEKKKQCLMRAVKLDPTNAEAQAQLDAMEDNVIDFADARSTRSRSTGGVSAGILSGIPGAPAKVGVSQISDAAQDFAQRSLAVLKGDVTSATAGATWWTAFTTTVIVAVMTGIFALLNEIILSIRRFESDLDFPETITAPLLVMIVLVAAAYSGAFASYWYASKQANGSGSLENHITSAIIIWAPAAMLMAVLIAVQALGIATGDFFLNNVLTTKQFIVNGVSDRSAFSWILTLIAAAAAVYTLFLMNKRFSSIHGFSGAPAWIAGIVMLLITSFVFV